MLKIGDRFTLKDGTMVEVVMNPHFVLGVGGECEYCCLRKGSRCDDNSLIPSDMRNANGDCILIDYPQFIFAEVK